MKLCFPVVKDQGLDSRIHNHFGSAPGFLVVDVVSGEVERIDNSDREHRHGACNPARAVAGLNLDGVVTGGIGMGALMSLNRAGYKVLQAQGATVRENIIAAQNGKLVEFSSDSICSGHTHSHGHGHEHGDGQHAGGCCH